MRKIILVVVIAAALAVALVWKLHHRGATTGPGAGSATAFKGPNLRAGATVTTPASLSGRVTCRSDGSAARPCRRR